MSFFKEDDCLASELVVPEHLCGWRTLVHGGVITTILDEVMSWAAISTLQRIILTQSISVEFKQPVHSGRKIRAEGRLLDRVSDREASMQGRLYNDAGDLCAVSSGVFALFSPEVARRLKIMDEVEVEFFREQFRAFTPQDRA